MDREERRQFVWPLGYLQVYGTAAVSRDRELATDVLTKVIGIMADEEVPESRLPQIEQMVDDEKRVVVRVRPYATFETPPRHVCKMSDIDTLTHFTARPCPGETGELLMTIAELLADAFGRIRETVHDAVDGLTPGQLTYRPEPGANSIAWLVWHLTRIQDDHIADVAGAGQVWTSGASGSTWADRFGLPFAASATGYGDGPEAVAAVQVKSGEMLTAYYDAVHQQTLDYIRGLTEADLDRVVDKSWDPPVTLGVRLVSVISDDLQHAGQACYLRGIIERG